MSTPAIRAAFADWRPVKSRAVLQLVLEVPIEQTKLVLDTLGAPIPGTEKWVGVALLNLEAGIPPPACETKEEPLPGAAGEAGLPAPSTASASGSRRRFADLPLPQQVALRCQDEQFRRWVTFDMG